MLSFPYHLMLLAISSLESSLQAASQITSSTVPSDLFLYLPLPNSTYYIQQYRRKKERKFIPSVDWKNIWRTPLKHDLSSQPYITRPELFTEYISKLQLPYYFSFMKHTEMCTLNTCVTSQCYENHVLACCWLKPMRCFSGICKLCCRKSTIRNRIKRTQKKLQFYCPRE